MGREIDLLANYPRAKRNVAERGASKTERQRAIAREFGEEFFDGDRSYGYGGFHYNPRFWQPVIPTLQTHFGLTGDSRVLDVGCAKGFMMYDMAQLIPGITVKGIDISATSESIRVIGRLAMSLIILSACFFPSSVSR